MLYLCKICSVKLNGRYNIERHSVTFHPDKDFVDSIEWLKPKPSKLWICPKCQKEYSYSDKYFHQQNAKKYCLKE